MTNYIAPSRHGLFRTLGLLALAVSIGACPGSSGGNGGPVTGAQARAGSEWICGTGIASDTCSCSARKPGWEGSSSSIPHCVAYKCCLLSETETESTLASCECNDTTASCEAEAEARKNTKVVTQCPPEDEDKAAMACAESAESCSRSYLAQNDLLGCCAGSVCMPNAAGVRVCQKGSEAQLELAQRCDKLAQLSGETTSFSTQDTVLRTSVGDVTLGPVKYAFSAMGPGGCLTGLDLTIGAVSCQVNVKAKIVDGALVPTYLTAFLTDCPGYTGSGSDSVRVDDAASLASALEFSFEGLSCDGGLVFESYCAAGTFDWHFTGQAIGGVTFDEQHLTVEGVTCNPQEPVGTCPTK